MESRHFYPVVYLVLSEIQKQSQFFVEGGKNRMHVPGKSLFKVNQMQTYEIRCGPFPLHTGCFRFLMGQHLSIRLQARSSIRSEQVAKERLTRLVRTWVHGKGNTTILAAFAARTFRETVFCAFRLLSLDSLQQERLEKCCTMNSI